MPPPTTPKMRYQNCDEEVGDGHHEQRRRRQVGAEVGEHLLERRDDEDHDHRGDDEGHRDDRDRVEQRRLDLRLDGLDLFLVGGEAVEQLLENTGLLAGRHQVAEQRVEVQRVLAERGGQRRAGLDLGLDLVQQPPHRRVRRALRDDVERLQQRHAGLHHGGELAGEQRDVLVADFAAAAALLLLDLGDQDALAAQRGVDDGLAARAHLAADRACRPCPCLPRGRLLPWAPWLRSPLPSLPTFSPYPASIAVRRGFWKV